MSVAVCIAVVVAVAMAGAAACGLVVGLFVPEKLMYTTMNRLVCTQSVQSNGKFGKQVFIESKQINLGDSFRGVLKHVLVDRNNSL